MMMEQRSSDEHWQPDGPFGSFGYDLSLDAKSLIEDLSADLEWSPGDPLAWETTDRMALECWFELDSGIPLLEVPFEQTGVPSIRLHDTILAFRTALPFNEAERAWLHAMRSVPNAPADFDPGQRIESQTGTIMVAGVRRPVSGHNLMSRWLAWRRQTDEYQGQGSLDQAREALQSLREQLR